MNIFINHSLYVGYSSSHYGTKLLQFSTLKSLTFSSGPRHAMLQYYMALLGSFDTIQLKKNVSHICDITLK